MTHLGCSLDENLSGESMTLKVIDKINNSLMKNRKTGFHLSLFAD